MVRQRCSPACDARPGSVRSHWPWCCTRAGWSRARRCFSSRWSRSSTCALGACGSRRYMDAKRVVIAAPGGPDVLKLEAFRTAEPGPAEVLLEQKAIAVNFIDVYHRAGVYPLPTYPGGIGAEANGRVIAVGSGVTDLQVGQRVAYVTGSPGS